MRIFTTTMKQVILQVKDGKYKFFMELIRSLDFVQVKEDQEDTKEEVLANLKQGFQEMKLYKEGKTKETPLEDFLDEL